MDRLDIPTRRGASPVRGLPLPCEQAQRVRGEGGTRPQRDEIPLLSAFNRNKYLYDFQHHVT